MATRSTKTKQAEPKGEPAKPHQLLLMSTAQSAIAMELWGKYAGDVDLAELVDGLQKKVDAVHDGDMKPVEAMLYGQAMTLQTMFTNLARRAANQEYLKQFQTHMTLALKAQAQCRSTLEALAQVKNPMPYIKQANIASGPQQVNNAYASTPSHSGIQSGAGNIHSAPNKLLEADHEQRMVIGTPGTASRINQAVETVEAVHRT